MSGNRVDIPGPSHVELIVEVSAPGLSQAEAERRWKGAGNEIIEVQGRTITAVAQIEGVDYDHSEADEGELVWACDYCGAYSRSKVVADTHERTCKENPDV